MRPPSIIENQDMVEVWEGQRPSPVLKDATGQLGPSGGQKPRSGEPAATSILADGSGQRRPGLPLVVLPATAPRTRTTKREPFPAPNQSPVGAARGQVSQSHGVWF